MVGAVYDQLHAALEKIVIQGLGVGLQSQEALFFSLLGEGHESRDQARSVLAFAAEHFPDHLRQAYDRGEREIDQQGAEGPAHHDKEGLGVDKGLEARYAFAEVDGREDEASEDYDAAECCYIHVRSPAGYFLSKPSSGFTHLRSE